ncbi:unnamed protein product [Thelazia callipaeda]|uniref:CRAL-TRIO domain-containing protein n=1 Tax=Thelazia callipaeda TaxID=103827 RepID=A0A0N5CUZ2_THECL|nr:unnamed protein product [Thelazia callipaeda]
MKEQVESKNSCVQHVETECERALRSALADEFKLFPSYGKKFSLERWLDEYDNDVDSVIPKLRWTLRTLNAIGAHQMDTSSIEAANQCLRNYNPIIPFFPGGLMSYDRMGNIVYVQPIGRSHPTLLTQNGRVSMYYKFLILEGFVTHQLICNEEERRNKRLGQIAIFDMNGLNRYFVTPSYLKLTTNIYRILQVMFPGVTRKVYVINTSSLVYQTFRFIQLFLTKKIRDVVEFLGDNWQSRLVQEIGEENLLPFWGGKMPAPQPSANIRMVLIRIISRKRAKSLEWANGRELELIKVPPRRCTTVTTNIQAEGQILKWYFICSGGDIEFYLLRDDEEIYPRIPLSTQFYPEFGEIKCDKTGRYDLCFDNQHSILRTKTISYLIEIIDEANYQHT